LPHETTLIATIAVAFVLAFGLGMLANLVRLPPLVGYLLAGALLSITLNPLFFAIQPHVERWLGVAPGQPAPQA
jgi:predicted Kef-type K+ transport protein